MAYQKLPQLTKKIVDRFWKKVKIMPSGCWEWQAALNKGGYGNFGIGKAKAWRANRIAYAIYYQHDPDQLQVCHTCDNRQCVNPFHFFLGTHASNATDRDIKGRQVSSAGEDHWAARLTASEIGDIRVRYARGEIQTSLAERYEITQAQVSQIVRGDSWKDAGGPITTTGQLTEHQVVEIRSRPWKYGMNKVLAGEFGVTAHYIADIRHRKSWKHI